MVVAFPADGPEGVGYAAVTAKDGAYRLRGLAPGDYVVRGFAPGYVGEFYDGTYSPDAATPVTVADGQPVSGVDFALAPAYYLWMRGGGIAAGNTVAGRVTTAQGAPVAGATVYLLDEAEQPVASVQTGPDGRYELRTFAVDEERNHVAAFAVFRGTHTGEGGPVPFELLEIGSSAKGEDPAVPAVVAVGDELPGPLRIRLPRF